MPRFATVALAAGAALLVRRAVRSRMTRAPLWPLPSLEVPVSGYGRGATVPRRVLVTGRAVPAEGVVELRLEGERLPSWEPGAHLDVVLPSGQVRQYSLCGDPGQADVYRIAARLVEEERGGRGGSREVHEQLHEGAEIEIRGPRNRFPLAPSPGYVFVAGGIGITPVLPMVRAAEAAGADWRLVYCGRSRATMPYLADLVRLGGDRVTVVAEDESGYPDLSFLGSVPDGTAVYCCGPDGLTDAVTAAMPAGRVPRLERFSGVAPAGGTPFEVELRRSGRTVAVAAGQSVLAAVREEVPDVMYSCTQGFCGTCRQTVLDGEVEHRDELLTDAERAGSMLICVSRCAGGKLVLDL
ncbi:iron-sulfur protein [Streptomyces omiyaensis]|uniref:PDR/VanB family oxidoreductase n=1 Tax=Streptomyces omiyaensis TaxID=68247 RepID=UPI001676B6C1|nr:PDR/VanB family oxidoreductase [Streptomyces omiyaensis]GGY53634.1 iron-sulfur protein [Streptomyces omiyaensis]